MKKPTQKCLAMLLIALMLFSMIPGMAMAEEESKQYAVTLDPNNGDELQVLHVVEGSFLDKPEDPSGKEGATKFREWRLDGKAYDFNTAVHGDMTLVAEYYMDNPETKYGVQGKKCKVDWYIEAVADQRIEDWTNHGFTYKVKNSFAPSGEAPGIAEMMHFSDPGNGDIIWRPAFATKYAIEPGAKITIFMEKEENWKYIPDSWEIMTLHGNGTPWFNLFLGLQPEEYPNVLGKDDVEIRLEEGNLVITFPKGLPENSSFMMVLKGRDKEKGNIQYDVRYTLGARLEGVYTKGSSPTCKDYSVTYVLGDKGTSSDDLKETVAYGDFPVAVPKVIAKEGFEFVGWQDEDGNAQDPEKVVILKDRTFTAVYKELPIPPVEVETPSEPEMPTEKRVDIPVVKRWEGGPEKRPQVTLELYRSSDGKTWEKAAEDLILSQEKGWKSSFKDVLKEVNGVTYTFRVQEKLTDSEAPRYTSKVEAAEGGFVITNRYLSSKVDVKMRKLWSGGGGERPTIAIQLYRNGQAFGDAVELKYPDLTYTWMGLDEFDQQGVAYVYSVDEVEVPKGYTKKVEGMVITNTLENTLPRTGSRNPWYVLLLGVVFLGAGFFIFKKGKEPK